LFSHSPKIVTDGLVLALDAGNTKSYTSGSTTWFDKSGNARNGTLTNGPTFSSANGGSIVFDGTNDYVGSTLTSQISNSFTFSSFVRLSTFSTTSVPSGIVVSEVASYSNYWAFLGTYQSKWHWGLYDGTSNPYIVSNIPPTTSLWTYITGVRDIVADTLYLYVNGILDSSTNDTTTSPPSYSAFNIGGQVSQPGGQNRLSNGSVSNTQIYNRALSADEIQQNFNALRGRYGI
jgi:hypothetical protein